MSQTITRPAPSPSIRESRVFPVETPPPPPDASPETTPEPFRADDLPSILREMVEHAALSTQAPISLCAAAGLACASAALGAGLCVQSTPSRLTYGNLYFLPVAESGTGKGESFKTMAAPFLNEEIRRAEEWREGIMPGLKADLGAAEADIETTKKALKKALSGSHDHQAARADLEQAIKRREETERALKASPILNIGNATAEKIGAALSVCPGEAAAILSAEGRDILDNILGRYSKSGKSSDESIYLQCYSGDPTVIRRLCREDVMLRAPRLTFFVAIQPDLARRNFETETLMESGFLARCITFDPKARPARASAHIIPGAVKEDWARLVLSLLENFHDAPAPVRTVMPSQAARAALETLLTEAADKREEGGEWADIAPFAARLGENAWRLALVLHAIEHGKYAGDAELSEETALAAVRLARWFFDGTLELLKSARGSKKARRLEKLLNVFAAKNATRITLRDLHRANGFEQEEVRGLAAAFPDRIQVVTASPSASGGRPSSCAELVPISRAR